VNCWKNGCITAWQPTESTICLPFHELPAAQKEFLNHLMVQTLLRLKIQQFTESRSGQSEKADISWQFSQHVMIGITFHAAASATNHYCTRYFVDPTEILSRSHCERSDRYSDCRMNQNVESNVAIQPETAPHVALRITFFVHVLLPSAWSPSDLISSCIHVCTANYRHHHQLPSNAGSCFPSTLPSL
jgi:hypothetical protein